MKASRSALKEIVLTWKLIKPRRVILLMSVSRVAKQIFTPQITFSTAVLRVSNKKLLSESLHSSTASMTIYFVADPTSACPNNLWNAKDSRHHGRIRSSNAYCVSGPIFSGSKSCLSIQRKIAAVVRDSSLSNWQKKYAILSVGLSIWKKMRDQTGPRIGFSVFNAIQKGDLH